MLAAVFIQSTLGRGLPNVLIVQCIYFHTKKYYHTLEGDCPYRILCSVLLGTADDVRWQVLSFQVDAHWREGKRIKSYLQSVEEAKIWQKQLSPSWTGYPPEYSKPVISQHSVGCSGIVCVYVCVCLCFCVFVCLCVLSVFVFIWLCDHGFVCMWDIYFKERQ